LVWAWKKCKEHLSKIYKTTHASKASQSFIKPLGKIFKKLLPNSLSNLLPTKLDPVTAASVAFLSCFLLAFVAGSVFLQPQSSKATTGLLLVGAPSLSISSGAGLLNMNITPTPSGSLVSSSHDITVSTNVPTGFNLALGMVGSPSITPITGTLSAPATLANNTWGFAINRVATSTDSNTITNSFDTTYATPIPSATSVWANPSVGSVIKNTNNSSTTDTTFIYFGARIDMDLTAGAYSNTVRYTATTNISSIPSPTISSITPNSGLPTGGTAIEIVGTGFTANDASVTTNVTLDGLACNNVTISSNTPTTGQDTIYCNVPANIPGAVDVVVSTWRGTAVEANGYEYVIPVVVSFVSPSIASTIAGTESGPVFTIVGSGFADAISVTIGGVSCASFDVLNDSQIFCRTPNTGIPVGSQGIVVMTSDATSNNDVAIAYGNTAYPTLQGFNAFANCTITPTIFRDTRDSQLYYVRKMEDDKCWMIDNLKYGNYGEVVSSGYLTADGTSNTVGINLDAAKYADPGAQSYCMGNTNMPANTVTRCGLLYNWYTATKGTGSSSVTENGANASDSICPANFRLPTGGAVAANSDFANLNGWMAGLGAPSLSNTSAAGWLPSGQWQGLYSGDFDSGFFGMGLSGYYRSATSISATNSYVLSMGSAGFNPGASGLPRRMGYAVRCVMDAPTTPPPPTNLPFGVLDVSPTTGWAGNRIDITSNNLFTNVTSVTVGELPCMVYEVLSASQIACRLPDQAAGSVNNIVIMNGGTDVANASTNNHMRITYFDPNRTETVGAGTTPRVYFNHEDTSRNFTSDDCANMTLGQIVNLTDIRNNQTYRVKKMTENVNGGRCWMIDNLKFPHEIFVASGAMSISSANYANPMGQSFCIGNTNMPATLTRCGYLYNWFAATYGTGNVSASMQFTNVNGSICPNDATAGTTSLGAWQLPRGVQNTGTAGNGHFAWLSSLMNNQAAIASATTNNTTFAANWLWNGQWQGVFSGVYLSGFYSVGSYGYYWSSTATSATSAYLLAFHSSGVVPGSDGSNRQDGFAVRCVMP